MKKLINKKALLWGLMFATLDFMLISSPLIYHCTIGSIRCGEELMRGVFHWPLILLVEPFLFTNASNTNFSAFLVVITGLIQYFFIGYIIKLITSYFTSLAHTKSLNQKQTTSQKRGH